jgi:hypothetical protein
MSVSGINLVGTYNIPLVTATANTAWLYLVPPWQPWSSASPNQPVMTGLAFLSLTVQGTAQTMYCMRPLGFTRTSAAAAAAATTIVLDADPGLYGATFTSNGKTYSPAVADNGIATNDYIAYQYPDGTWEYNKATGVTGLTVTITALNANNGLPKGSGVYWFGIQTDTNPYDNQAHPKFNLFASIGSGLLTIGNEASNEPFVAGYGPNNPLLLYNANATAASTLERGTVSYYQIRPSPFGNGPIPLPNPAPNG